MDKLDISNSTAMAVAVAISVSRLRAICRQGLPITKAVPVLGRGFVNTVGRAVDEVCYALRLGLVAPSSGVVCQLANIKGESGQLMQATDGYRYGSD